MATCSRVVALLDALPFLRRTRSLSCLAFPCPRARVESVVVEIRHLDSDSKVVGRKKLRYESGEQGIFDSWVFVVPYILLPDTIALVM